MAPPLTIGFVSSTFAPLPGGREAYLDHLSCALAERGHEVRVSTRFVDRRPEPFQRLLAAYEPAQRDEVDGVHVRVITPAPYRQVLLSLAARMHYYPSTELMAIRLYRTAFARSLAEALDGCDVVHYSGTGRELIGFVAQHVAAQRGIPFFVTPHMHVGSWGDSDLDFRLYRRADRLIALTEYERRAYVTNGIPTERIHVQGHGLNVTGTGDANRFRRETGIGDAPLILFLGRKSAEKGYPLLLRAAPALWARHPTAHLVFAGPADEATSLNDAETRIAADPRVREYGFVSDDLREDLYAACDL